MNPKLVVDVDGVEQTVELLLLSSSRRLSDERLIQQEMGYQRYADWARGSEGWSAPDAQYALIKASLNRADISFSEFDLDAESVVEAIREALESLVGDLDDGLDPTNGESSD